MDDLDEALPGRTYVRPAEGVLLQKERVSGDMVLLDTRREIYYGLNAVGVRMLELACELPGADEIVWRLESEYDADASVLRKDLHNLLADMADRGLVVWGRPADGPGAT